MLYILAGIVGMCGLICFAGAAEWVWDKLDEAAEARTKRENIIKIHSRKDNAAWQKKRVPRRRPPYWTQT